MKRLIAPAVLALLAAIVSPPANAAITPTCIYGGGGITQATNGAVVVVNSQDHVCLLSPLPVASAGTVLTSTGVGAAPQFTAPAAGPTATPFPGAVVPTPSATGQMISSTNGSTFSLLNVGTANQCLLSNGTIPGWSSACGLLAANQTWAGINAFTNAAGSNFGTPGSNNSSLVNVAEGVGGDGGFMHIGANAAASCAGVAGTAFALDDITSNGTFLTINDGSGRTGICNPLMLPGDVLALASDPNNFASLWRPATAPTCTVGAGGTTCTTAAFGAGGVPLTCTANVRGSAPPSGFVSEVDVSAPGVTVTATYTSSSAWVAGGVITFNVTCL
jgi:hypothetical protein